jgi:hypothetical protein
MPDGEKLRPSGFSGTRLRVHDMKGLDGWQSSPHPRRVRRVS